MEIKIEAKGIKEAGDMLVNLRQGTRKGALDSAARSGGTILRDEARSGAPVGKNAHLKMRGTKKKFKHYKLRDSIKSEKLGKLRKNSDAKGYRVTQGRAFHGLYLEKGTKKMRAHPWLVPAARRAQARIVSVMSDAIKAYVLKIANRQLEKFTK